MNYIIFDLEAQFKKDDRSFRKETVEIGASKVIPVKNGLIIQDTFDTLVKPVITPELTKDCIELTTITQEEVDLAPFFPQALNAFRTWIGREPFKLISWGGYDKRQLVKDCHHWNVNPKWIVDRHIDLREQHARYVLKQSKRMGMKRALEEAAITLEGHHHRGNDDANNIAKIFIQYFDYWKL